MGNISFVEKEISILFNSSRKKVLVSPKEVKKPLKINSLDKNKGRKVISNFLVKVILEEDKLEKVVALVQNVVNILADIDFLKNLEDIEVKKIGNFFQQGPLVLDKAFADKGVIDVSENVDSKAKLIPKDKIDSYNVNNTDPKDDVLQKIVNVKIDGRTGTDFCYDNNVIVRQEVLDDVDVPVNGSICKDFTVKIY